VLGRLLGIEAGLLDERVERAIAFAGLEEAVDQPEKTFSTGMTARLGLSMALEAPADLLLLDEVLAVGDAAFRRRAIDRLRQRCEEGVSVLFVSHDLQMVEQLCDRVLRLDHGRCVADGPTASVVGGYAGRSWAGGVRDAEGGVRIHRLDLDRRRVPTGAALEVRGRLEVDEPCPGARLEVALRSPPPDRDEALTIAERASLSATMTTVVPTGAELTRPGSYEFVATLHTGRLVGEADLVVSAVDEGRHLVLAEVWEQVVIGSPDPGAHLTFDPGLQWSVTPLADPAGHDVDLPHSAG
jgi:hypothetical protein